MSMNVTSMRDAAAASIGLLLLAALPASAAEKTYQSSPERRSTVERDWGPWLGPFRAKLVPVLMQDFGERYIYRDANAALPPPHASEQRVVFIGDSITDRWNLASSFPGKAYVIPLDLLRDGARRAIAITIVERPDPVVAQMAADKRWSLDAAVRRSNAEFSSPHPCLGHLVVATV